MGVINIYIYKFWIYNKDRKNREDVYELLKISLTTCPITFKLNYKYQKWNEY